MYATCRLFPLFDPYLHCQARRLHPLSCRPWWKLKRVKSHCVVIPGKRKRASSEKDTLMHLSYINLREGKACKNVITASLHKAYLFHSASLEYAV